MQPPRPPQAQQGGGKNAATLTALLLLVACAGGLFFLVMLIAPFALGILVIGMLFVPMAVMHYLVWGRWLEQMNRQTRQDELDDEKR